MKLHFTKMHGLGNDFILIDCTKHELRTQSEALGAMSQRLCDRRFGIGADQLLLLCPSEKADFRMKIFNADGSEVEMCGNGIRCLAKYIWDRGLSDKPVLDIETAAGVIRPERSGAMVKVDMGMPVFEGRLIPVNVEGTVKDFPLTAGGETFRITCVSMGNPHAVIVVDKVGTFEVKKYGPLIEVHELFPRRTNVEFIQIVGPREIRMRVWERGAGETMACGTGASAAAVAANSLGLTERDVKVVLPGGELFIEWTAGDHVFMTGPAEEVFSGEIILK